MTISKPVDVKLRPMISGPSSSTQKLSYLLSPTKETSVKRSKVISRTISIFLTIFHETGSQKYFLLFSTSLIPHTLGKDAAR